MGLLMWWLLVDEPKDAPWLSKAECDALLLTLERERTRAKPAQNFFVMAKDSRVAMLTAIMFTLNIAISGIAIWLPLILKGQGLSNTATGFVSAIPYLAATIATPLWGWLVDRTGNHIVHLIVASAMTAAGLTLSVLQPTLVPGLIGITIALVGLGGARPALWGIPAQFLAGVAAAGGVALINSLGAIGNSVGPYMVGWLKDRTASFSAGISVMAGAQILSTALAVILAYMLRKRARTALATQAPPTAASD
jgi:cyanate permease